MRVHGTHLRCEGSEGSEGSKGSEGKVDDPSGRGLWPPAGGRLCPHRGNDSLHFVRRSAPSKCVRCASLRSGRAAPAALRVADCPSRAMLIKSALRDLLPVSYSMISILRIGSLRSPPPIRLRRTSPCSGGQNKTPRNILFINGSTVSTGYSATACGGGKRTGFIGEPRDPRIQ